LCQILWKETAATTTATTTTTTTTAATTTAAATTEDIEETEKEEEEEQATDTLYQDYKKQYCLRHVRTFFNHHLDDAWFRQTYSPCLRYRLGLEERKRAQVEAQQMKQQCLKFLQESQLTSALSLGHGSKTQSNSIPEAHVLSITECSLVVHSVPSHCTEAQVQAAVVAAVSASVDAESIRQNNGILAPTVTSSSPVPDSFTRNFVLSWNSTETRQLVWNALLQSQNASSAALSSVVVPRRSTSSHHNPSHSNEQVFITMDCTDPYGRLEYDADGRGAAPADSGNGVVTTMTKRTVTCQVSLPPAQRVTVLSMAISAKARIPRDYQAAATIANALDVKKQIAQADRLETWLHKLPQQHDTAFLLDTCIAYLRRVHLFSFYNGCSMAFNVADVITNNHVASTIHLRLKNADELLVSSTSRLSSPLQSGPKREREHDDDDNDSIEKGEDKSHHSEEATDSIEPNTQGEKEPVMIIDMLVQRLNDSIAKAMQDCNTWIQAADNIIDESVDRDARAIENAEQAAIEHWIHDHSVLDDDGRARCSFHFCHKLFKDASFLTKHLLKKHPEFLKAEQAKCHDKYMMETWDATDDRPVPDVLVDCGKQFGLVPAKIFGREPDCTDPEPEMWQLEQKKRQRDEELRKRRELDRQMRKQTEAPRLGGGGGAVFVDVDDMKEEKVEISFENIEVPVLAKKKKKRKLL
jgi:hypothetical protein